MRSKTFASKVHFENGGWQQNSIQSTYLGLSKDAKDMVIKSFSTWNKNFRVPAFGGPYYDWTPDLDHGCVAMNALQRILIQYKNDKVYLFPAWPKEWDVKFKTNALNNITIEGVYEKGMMVKQKTIPKNNKNKVQFINPKITKDQN